MCVNIRTVAILGCTGSIGKTTLNVIRRNPNRFRVVFLANNSKKEEIIKLAKEFNVNNFFCGSGLIIENGREIPFDKDYLGRPHIYLKADIVVNGIVGLSGLLPTYAVILANRILATANKESIVCAGNLINKLLCDSKCKIRPVDSEHSTVWQCLDKRENVNGIILTASGGAFRDFSDTQLKNATSEQALMHPNWLMGKKVTIDCATLVNKGIEIIEAKRLFNIDNVSAVMHRESIIHSLVEMKDGAMIAGLSNPDMEIPIQYALTFPERINTNVKMLNLAEISKLTFSKIDEKRFPCFGICKEVARFGDYAGTIFNASDEIAVDKFMKNEISFYGIAELIQKALEKFGMQGTIESIDEVYRIDRQVREYILRSI